MIKREPWRLFYLFLFLPLVPFAAIGLVGSARLKSHFLSYLAGINKNRLDTISEDFVKNDVLPEIFPEIRKMLEDHQNKGHYTILNTASPTFYAKYIAQSLNFDVLVGTEFEIGESFGVIGKIIGQNNKRYIKIFNMKEYLPSNTKESITAVEGDRSEDTIDYDSVRIAGSTAYTDSKADLPLLLLSENGFLVHPVSSELIAEGKKRGWQILKPKRHYNNNIQKLFGIVKQMFGIYRPIQRGIKE